MPDWLRSLRGWNHREARERILKGPLPRRVRMAVALNLSGQTELRALPAALTAPRINVSRCARLRALPVTLQCRELSVRHSGVENLPAAIAGIVRIDAEGCQRLRSVGAYSLDELILRNCPALEFLPAGLRVKVLNLSGNRAWERLPESVVKTVEQLDISGCTQISELPDCFARLEVLNLAGCRNLVELPEGIRIRSSIDVAETGITQLPWSLRSVRLFWHGVEVSDRIAFDPESITAGEILEEPNQALRRVLLERMGLERFFDEARPEVLDEDSDAGGKRRLLRIAMSGNSAIVCVQVNCPSTGGRYLLRVPPTTRTCHEAVAWTAGYSDPQDYFPVVET